MYRSNTLVNVTIIFSTRKAGGSKGTANSAEIAAHLTPHTAGTPPGPAGQLGLGDWQLELGPTLLTNLPCI
uniref:Uncharacterized protein n=1 Tax=Rhizophora mucronata TaxID=61149 RepID=A0A2P2P1J8_RHIMU